MVRASLYSLIATALVPTVVAVEVPLDSVSSHHWHDEHHPAILGNEDVKEWNLSKVPNPNATDHLVFETVYSLLQHWPNTRMRNGHNIVPGIIPKGTLLYHGTSHEELPPGPEWVAMDPEHSYHFCRNERNCTRGECWHLTLAANRPLKVVYFDGTSAAKLPYGSLDTQDLIAWGRSGSGDLNEDGQRIQDLCDWGKKFAVDGFVRMEMSFEVMLCDFMSGVSAVSFVKLVNRLILQPMMSSFVGFETVNSGSWHNRFPGETRIQLDLAGLVSFYDTQLVPSLIDIRANQERWDHRVQNTSSEDLLAVKSRLKAALIRPGGISSGIDWKMLFQVIVDRYAGRLELTRYLLNSTVGPGELLDLANKTQIQLRIMMTPYLLLSATPTDQSDEAELDWTVPIYKLCATTHTYFMESESNLMTDSEKLLLQAVRGTTREVCRVVTKMWAAGVHVGVDPLLNTKESPDIAQVTRLRNTWAEDLNHLMGWLDWSVWVKCNPGCGPEEMCYLSTWPIGFPPARRGPGCGPPSLSELDSTHPDEWVRPQPRCISRLDPSGFGLRIPARDASQNITR